MASSRKVAVSAPGKTILMGEHAAVYGRPALVAAVDRRLWVELETVAPDGGLVHLDLPQLGVGRRLPWGELAAYARDRREAWRAYAEAPTPARLARVLGDDPAHLVKVAVGEALGWADRLPPASARLAVRSDLPVGAGFGSSAAAALAVTRAVLDWLGAGVDRRALEDLALEVERRQHGSPSGVDTATVLRGGVVWFERTAAGLEAHDVAGADVRGLRLYHSGTPAEATGTVVAAVRQRRDRDGATFDRGLDRAAALTAELRAELASGRAEPAVVVRCLREFQTWLETIGVVPQPVRDAVRRVEAAGGAAKISGAGSLAGPGAGSLLVYHPRPEEIDRGSFLDRFERLDLGLGAPGLRTERWNEEGLP